VSDFTNILLADEGQAATALTLVRSSELADWLESLTDSERRWVEMNKFAAKPHELLLYPTANGSVAVTYGIGTEDTLGIWAIAAAAARIPSGTYRLQWMGREADLAHALTGWLLTHYDYGQYKKIQTREQRRLLLKDIAQASDAIAMADAISLVRDLVTTPTADMGPEQLSDAARNIADEFGATFSEIIGDDLLVQNFPSVHAVGRASPRAPRLIDFVWGNPAHPKVTLVGKGVCFDTGGYNMKTGSGMGLMKKDMGGAAHALAMARLVMGAHLPVRLRVIVPAVENMIAGNAFVPGDVLATRKGLSVEVTNTDAEGRLILSDALTLACEDAPDLLLDFATLTGAARVALGPDLPALFTPDDMLATGLLAAAKAVDDPIWQLPLWQGYNEMLTSSLADLQNSPDSGFAGAITAALFLQRFVLPETAWAHFDVYCWNPSSKPGRPKGGEAMALRACWFHLRNKFAHR
jgi:leucyl aminopeptidase